MRLPSSMIANAHLDFLQAIEHIELRKRDALNAGGLDGLAHQHRIKPAAAALAACHRAKLAAALANPFAHIIGLFRRERPRAHARRVGLADAKHIVTADGPMPEPAAACPATVFDEVT